MYEELKIQYTNFGGSTGYIYTGQGWHKLFQYIKCGSSV